MFDLIVIIIIIAVIVSKVKANSQKNERRTTYVNGKPVKTQSQNSGYSSYKPNNTYDQAQKMQELRNKVTRNLEQMRANAQNTVNSGRSYAANGSRTNGYQQKSYQSSYTSNLNTQTNTYRQVGQPDILSRAKQNVKENEVDFLKEADKRQHEAARGAADAPVMTPSQNVAMQQVKPVGQQIGAEFDDDCDIMSQINDLMIMGYSGNLEFDRDFVAEGVDMLNRYQELGSNL